MSTAPTPPTNPNESVTEKAPPLAPPSSSNTVQTTTPATANAAAPAWVIRVDYTLLGLLLLLTFFLGSFAATNADLWMNLAVGRSISEGTHTFGVDPYSWATEPTGRGVPPVYWVNHSWLYSWLLYQLYTVLGGAGVVVIKALAVVVAIGLLSRMGWTESTRWFILMCLTLAALAMSGRLFLQPQVVSLLFLALTLFVLDRAGVFALATPEAKAPCDRCLWALPPLFALWANLDHWFILGPLTVGLCWAGTGLARWFKGTGHVPPKTLGILFGAGLLACVLNPFGVFVFQLPPELAYLLLSITDPLGVPWPDALVAGGRTLMEMRKAQVDPGWTMSALTMDYWQREAFGWNIAALALIPLLLLGIGAFTLVALVKPQKDAPTLHTGRFLLWLVFGVMALALYRLIPFFALVAAPLTAMTLGEFLHWQQESAAVTRERRDRGLNLARGLSVPFLLLLLGLAWPGMLHAISDGYAPRHVAWEVRGDPSLERAALTLKELRAQGECRNVFNVGLDLGPYLAWHAPEIKYGLDTRLYLYAREIEPCIKARLALVNKDRPDTEWHRLFEDRAIDQVVLAGFFNNNPNNRDITESWWRQAGIGVQFVVDATGQVPRDEVRWRFRYGDSKSMVFSWAGRDKRWPPFSALDDLNKQAFGVVPKDRKPPATGAFPRTTDFWTNYTQALPPTPPEVGEWKILAHQREVYERFGRPGMMRQVVHDKQQAILPHRHLMLMALTSSLCSESAAPGIATHISTMYAADLAPPAYAILMMRAVRRAIAANPADAQCHIVLSQAAEMTRSQENFAANQFGINQVRDRVRELQFITGQYNAAQLRPDSYLLQKNLAEIYLRESMIDMALEQLLVAQKSLETIKATGKMEGRAIDPRGIDAELKAHKEILSTFEQKVKERLAKWRDVSEGKSHVEKAVLAFGEPYTEVHENQQFRTNLGLGKKALEILQSIPQGEVKPEEQTVYIALQFELLLRMGRADLIVAELRKDELRKRLNPRSLAHFDLYAGAAIGDYESSDRGAKGFEDEARTAWPARRSVLVARTLATPAAFLGGGINDAVIPTQFLLAGAFHDQGRDICSFLTLRGIFALEAGDTKTARTHFQAALDQAAHMYDFPDRPLAKRYLDLINDQLK